LSSIVGHLSFVILEELLTLPRPWGFRDFARKDERAKCGLGWGHPHPRAKRQIKK
jgi:hypothetical protein